MKNKAKYNLSATSLARLHTCHADLINAIKKAIQITPVDFGVSEGHRSIAGQQRLYAVGRTLPGAIVTNIDGVNKLSKHNHDPSQAVDVFAYYNGAASWDAYHLCVIAGVILSCAQDMGIGLRWGGNWDMDGEIISDQKFVDLPHFELTEFS